jgi:hypothetical protein
MSVQPARGHTAAEPDFETPPGAAVTGAHSPSRDFRPGEIAAAFLIAIAAQGGAILALRASQAHRPAAAPEIEISAATPVKIVPVLDTDSPLLKLGGKSDPAKLPDRWINRAPKLRAEEKAFVSTKAGKTEEDIHPPEVKVAAEGEKPPPPNAELTKQVDAPLTADIDAGAPANIAEEGHQDGVKEGTETDPLKARAVDLYRARIIGWFSRRFRVSGSGLPADELAKYRVSATVDLSSDRVVTGYSIAPSGNAAFDAAARAALESAKSDSLPPPPENYPDVVQRQISLTFVCKEDRCD